MRSLNKYLKLYFSTFGVNIQLLIAMAYQTMQKKKQKKQKKHKITKNGHLQEN